MKLTKKAQSGTISPLVIAFGVFAVIISVGFTFLSSLSENNPDAVSSTELEKYQNTFDRSSDYSTSSTTVKTNTESISGSDGLFGFINSLVNNAWNSVVTLFTTFSFISDVIGGISATFGIPSVITTIGIAIVTFTLGFGILAFIFNRIV